MTIAKPSYDELSPDLRYKIWQQQNRGAVAKAGLRKAVGAIVGKAYWIALAPLVLFVAVPQVNDAVTSAQFIKQIWDLKPLTKVGKVELNELDSDQKRIASDIIAVGKEVGASERDTEIALMVANQESGMRELEFGDNWHFAATAKPGESTISDSVGVFQQRDSWGDRACRISAKCSAKLFYSALLKDNDRDSKPKWEAAADVQRPAAQYRQHYQQWEGLSDRIIKSAKQTAPEKVFPIAGLSFKTSDMTSPYGDRTHPVTGVRSKHWGQDIAITQGTALVAPEDGIVSDVKNSQTGCGKELTITAADGSAVRFCHLSAISVIDGQSVKAGQEIGKSGGEVGSDGAGSSTGPHLHFERIENGASVDPSGYLKSLNAI